jgi:hypothetical protein
MLDLVEENVQDINATGKYSNMWEMSANVRDIFGFYRHFNLDSTGRSVNLP